MVVRSYRDERLLARPKTEGVRGPRPWHPAQGGGEDLRHLDADHREVPEAKKGRRSFGPGKIDRPKAFHLRDLRGAAGPVEAARRERRGHPRAPLRAVGKGAGGEGFRFHHEPRGAQAGLDVQKKSLGASERDEHKRGAWREYVRTL